MTTVTRVTIDGAHWLDADAATSWARMRAAGLPAGGITEAGRTYARQAELYRMYLAGKLPATAARPGTSNHESGRAVDMQTTSAAHAWLIANGAAHGWSRPLLNARKPEPWHWEYSATRDRHYHEPVPAPAPTPVPERSWFDMASKTDLIDAIRETAPVRVWFFAHGNATYEADVEQRTYRALPNTRTLADRKTVLTRSGIRWDNWSGPVENPAAFGTRVD